MDYSKFGSAEQPLRASALPMLVRCPFSFMLALSNIDEDSIPGVAADTGSAVHFAARAWHTVSRKDNQEALELMALNRNDYPAADLERAKRHAEKYFADPRNQQAKIVLCEEKISVTIEAAPEDVTKRPIVINGTLDQVREENGQLAVWDIKTGKRLSGYAMLDDHCLQLAAYMLGAKQKLNRRIAKSGIIRTEDYVSRGAAKPVFWASPMTQDDALLHMLSVRRIVAMIRNRHLYHAPGEHCNWCLPGKTSECLPLLQELTVVNNR
jgi:RecB family exonuclease